MWHPLRKDTLCTPHRARVTVVGLSLIASIIYTFKTWTSGIVSIDTLSLCMPYPQYYNFLTAMTGVDSILTLIVPSIIVIVLNIRIILKIVRVEHRRKPVISEVSSLQGIEIQQEFLCPLKSAESVGDSMASSRIVHVKFHTAQKKQTASESGTNSTMAVTLIKKVSRTQSNSFHMISTSETCQRKSKRATSSKSNNKSRPLKVEVHTKSQSKVCIRGHRQYRTARMLIVVSSVFVILKVPTHVFRIHTFIQTSVHDNFNAMKQLDVRWQELFQIVYYMNFALNFFIYSACGSQFRRGLRILCTRTKHRLRKMKQVICR